MPISRIRGGPVTFYRIVKSNPPTLRDFRSNKALGRSPRGRELETPELHEGISVNRTLEQAYRKAVDLPMLGDFVAELRVPAGSAVEYAKTPGGAGHHTLWADPSAIQDCVVSVLRVERPF